MIHGVSGGESTIYLRRIQGATSPHREAGSVIGFVRTRTRQLEGQMSHDLATSRRSSDTWGVAALVLITLFIAPAVLTIVTIHTISQRDQPGDEQLIENLRVHEAEFDELVQMLNSDCRSLPAGAGEFIDLARLSSLVTSVSRREMYKRLLRQIFVTDLRYFPGTGKLMLLPAGTQTNIDAASKTYIYRVGGQPQPVVARQGHNWRGPGLYFRTGDRQLKGFWFIHYDMTITLALSPY
jgi:hypothetical protein